MAWEKAVPATAAALVEAVEGELGAVLVPVGRDVRERGSELFVMCLLSVH